MSMSHDPPPPGGTPQEPAYSERYPQDPGEPPRQYHPYGDPDEYARNRVRIPAILLIVVGAIGVLWGLYLGMCFVVYMVMPTEAFKQIMINAGILEGGMGDLSYGDLRRITVTVCGVLGPLALLGSILQIIAGIRMLYLRSYGLSVFSAITACVPCVGCMGCCGLGQLAGIWTIVVLMDPLVRQAFFTPPGTLNYPAG